MAVVLLPHVWVANAKRRNGVVELSKGEAEHILIAARFLITACSENDTELGVRI